MRSKQNWQDLVSEPKNKAVPASDHRKIFKELVDIGVKDTVRTWRGFQRWADAFQDSWGFRGHADASWDLEASLNRAAVLKWSSGIYRCAASEEGWLLREFQRRAHQYLSRVPDDHEVIDWFALMQHYRAPTRLLDWTRSPYIANRQL